MPHHLAVGKGVNGEMVGSLGPCTFDFFTAWDFGRMISTAVFVAKPALWNQTYARMCWILQHQPTYLTQLSQYIHGNEARIFHPRNRHIHVKQKKHIQYLGNFEGRNLPGHHWCTVWRCEKRTSSTLIQLPTDKYDCQGGGKCRPGYLGDYLGDSWWFSMFPVKKAQQECCRKGFEMLN